MAGALVENPVMPASARAVHAIVFLWSGLVLATACAEPRRPNEDIVERDSATSEVASEKPTSRDSRCTADLTTASTARERDRLTHALDATRVKTDGDLTLWQTSAGPVWTPPRAWGEHVARNFHAPGTGRWTRIDGDPDLTPVRNGDIVIDGGAHVGDSPRHALLLGAAHVVAVEPDPDNLRALRRNLARDIEAGAVTVVDQGLYDRQGRLTFVRRNNSWDGEFHEPGDAHGGADGEALPVTTIDRIVADLRLPRVDLIKLDIEGSEVPALRGAAETIRRFKPRIAVATYHKPDDLAGVEAAVAAVRQDYTITPSRCLPAGGRVIPNLLYFH